MKHLDRAQLDLLANQLVAIGLQIGPSEQRLMAMYLDAVIEANLALNLTRISAPADGVRLHLVDSLLALRALVEAPSGPLCDIGTGGGFPGVPLCIAAGRPGVLLDSVGKKARAVNGILGELGLDSAIIAVHERAEDHARQHPGGYSVVTARAVSELPALVELSSPLLRDGGRLVALKGAPEQEELERGREAALLAGMREVEVEHLALPMGGERRCIVVYERRGTSRTRLPRRPGDAQRVPLA